MIGTLEYWLEKAKRDRDLHYIALATVNSDDQVAYDYAGIFGLEDRAQTGLLTVMQDLDAIMDERRLGPRDFCKDASYVEWKFNCGVPVNHDFLIWLVDAEMTRRRLKGPAPLKVYFSNVDRLDIVGLEFFECVFRPILPLIGAVEDPDAKGGRHKPVYVPMDIVARSRSGEEVPKLNASRNAHETIRGWLHGTRPITITTREAPHNAQRNSDMAAWYKFAFGLQTKGEHVVFIRDTYRATWGLPAGLASCPAASWRYDLRMALYQQAKCNMYIANGPAGLGFFCDTPYLYFVNIKRDPTYTPSNPGWWKKSNGIDEGEQWPWSNPLQRLIWKPDSYANICAAWEELEPDLSRTHADAVPA